jgi:tRNA threonylcarbamoyl adenosine modification protein (Sua5/YciO/YrdC/YwlC family)
MSAVEEAAAAIRAGGLAVIPTDTVYGLACSPYREEPVARLSALKRRPATQPVALLAADVDMLLECVPELRGRAGVLARALLPGPYTLVLPNPAHRFPWLTGGRLDAIGVRVPDVAGPGRRLLDAIGAVAATSANLHGGRDPRRLEDVPAELLAEATPLDAGELLGTPSTVVDVTGPDPRVLREGAVPSGDALARIARVLSQ